MLVEAASFLLELPRRSADSLFPVSARSPATKRCFGSEVYYCCVELKVMATSRTRGSADKRLSV